MYVKTNLQILRMYRCAEGVKEGDLVDHKVIYLLNNVTLELYIPFLDLHRQEVLSTHKHLRVSLNLLGTCFGFPSIFQLKLIFSC